MFTIATQFTVIYFLYLPLSCDEMQNIKIIQNIHHKSCHTLTKQRISYALKSHLDAKLCEGRTLAMKMLLSMFLTTYVSTFRYELSFIHIPWCIIPAHDAFLSVDT